MVSDVPPDIGPFSGDTPNNTGSLSLAKQNTHTLQNTALYMCAVRALNNTVKLSKKLENEIYLRNWIVYDFNTLL